MIANHLDYWNKIHEVEHNQLLSSFKRASIYFIFNNRKLPRHHDDDVISRTCMLNSAVTSDLYDEVLEHTAGIYASLGKEDKNDLRWLVPDLDDSNNTERTLLEIGRAFLQENLEILALKTRHVRKYARFTRENCIAYALLKLAKPDYFICIMCKFLFDDEHDKFVEFLADYANVDVQHVDNFIKFHCRDALS